MRVAGTTRMFVTLAGAPASGRHGGPWRMPVVGYGFAAFGRFVFARSRPATLRHPCHSLAGDFATHADVLRGHEQL